MLKRFKKINLIAVSMLMIFNLNSFAVNNISNMPNTQSQSKQDFTSQESLNNSSSNTILTTSSAVVGTKTDFYLIINLNNISFTKFSVKITNSSSLAAENLTGNVSNLSTNSVVTTFDVDKSNISNLNKLGIVYTSPEEDCTLTFNVEITNLDSTDLNNAKANYDNATANLSVLEQAITDAQNNYNQKSSEVSKAIDELKALDPDLTSSQEAVDNLNASLAEYSKAITDAQSKYDQENATVESYKNEYEKILSQMTVTENVSVSVNSKATLNQLDGLDNDEMLMNDKLMMADKEKMAMKDSMNDMLLKVQGLQNDLDGANKTISSLTTSVTYQGEQNNYLSSLSIAGVEFKNTFNKTNTSYFATVDSSVNNVTVNATAEDSTADITIYGNTGLKTGKNKILITVTADDGSTRIYKIYVTKN